MIGVRSNPSDRQREVLAKGGAQSGNATLALDTSPPVAIRQDGRCRTGESAGSESLSSYPMKLYYVPGACSLAPHIVLREAGIEAELVRVDLSKQTTADGANFADINPRGYVPVLELPNGEHLTENAAILQYLADRSPHAALAPSGPGLERYRLQEWLSFCGSELLKTIGPLFNPALHDSVRRELVARLSVRLGWADSQLGGRNFVLGERFSVADAYLFAVLGMLRLVGLNLADWPALAAHSIRVGSRPAVQAALKAEVLA